MTKRKILASMRHIKLWQHCTQSCQDSFIKEMRGRQYGHEAIIDAFNWFVIGWKAAIINNISERCGQLNSEQHQAEENTPNELALVSNPISVHPGRSVPYL